MNKSLKSSQPATYTPSRGSLSNLPWWAIVLVLAALVVIYLILADGNYRATFIFLAAGVVITLRITLIAFPIATFIGLFVGLARLSKNTALQTLATLYIEVVRGIPLVVLILLIAFELVPIFVELVKRLGELGLTFTSTGILGSIFNALASFNIRAISFEFRAIIALSIGYGAFEAEVFRAGIQSIGKGQMEAARSLGMSYVQSMRLIILPQAIRRILPPLGNDFIALLKDSFPGNRVGGERAHPAHPPAALEHLPPHGSLQRRCISLSVDDADIIGVCPLPGAPPQDRRVIAVLPHGSRILLEII